jgi:ABC-2 type transport system ATP-binding protein
VGAAAIRVAGLQKSYGQVEAVRDISFEVIEGECLALLGPNGAGKTTTVEILEGFRPRSAGEVEVLGMDPEHAGRDFRERIGIVLQSSGLDRNLSVRETVGFYRGYYPRPRDADEIIELVGLTEKSDARVKALSGGQRRRLDLALGIVGDPSLIFLDEPTTGFDPSARRRSWELVDNLRSLGKTILLTTHYMDEAQNLADRVVVLSGGRIVAEGSPETLGGRDVAEAVISFRLPTGLSAADLPGGLAMELRGNHVSLRTASPTKALNVLTDWALARGAELEALLVSRPSLEDVYLQLTGGEHAGGAVKEVVNG